MTFAIAQATLDPGCRSRSLNRMMAAIRAAAKSTPAPDVIILSNVADHSAGGENPVTPAMCRSVTEAFSLQARQWGVWLMVGHALLHAGEVVNGLTLFDPDGDPYLRVPDPASARCEARADDWTQRPTPMGHIAIAMVDTLVDAPATELLETTSFEGQLNLLVLHCPSGKNAPQPPLDDVKSFARRNACSVAVLANETCAFVGTTGETLAETQPGISSVDTIQLDITPLSPATISRWDRLGDHE